MTVEKTGRRIQISESCIKMTYAYDGSSERITDMKEELAEWDGDWDF